MIGGDVQTAKPKITDLSVYDPFVRGPFPVGVRTLEAMDTARDRLFPCEIWYPAASQHAGQDIAPQTQDVFTLRDEKRTQMAVRNAEAEPGTYPLIIYSHPSGAHRRAATFLCTHLSSHGYVVAALDHSESVVPELGRKDGETTEQSAARVEVVVASRVPDIRFLLDHLLSADGSSQSKVDPDRIGIVGHSLGGWTVLAAAESDSRIRSIVALAPAGSSNPRPGIIRAKLTFDWGRDVPALYLAAEYDTPIPLDGVVELYQRTPGTKQMVVLRRADHMHFMDNVEHDHEMVRKMEWPGDLAWMAKEIRPMTELCSEDEAHRFVRGLTLAHMDSVLKEYAAAQQFLAGDLKAALLQRGVDAFAHNP